MPEAGGRGLTPRGRLLDDGPMRAPPRWPRCVSAAFLAALALSALTGAARELRIRLPCLGQRLIGENRDERVDGWIAFRDAIQTFTRGRFRRRLARAQCAGELGNRACASGHPVSGCERA